MVAAVSCAAENLFLTCYGRPDRRQTGDHKGILTGHNSDPTSPYRRCCQTGLGADAGMPWALLLPLAAGIDKRNVGSERYL